MNTPTSYSTFQPQPTPQKSGKGCFFYGCLTIIVLLILSAIAIYFAVRGAVRAYTDDKPRVLPAFESTPSEVASALAKVEQLRRPGAKISLTEREINSLISNLPSNNPLKDSLRVRIKDNRVGGTVSMDLGMFGFSGRYLNGDGEFGVKIVDGQPFISLKSLSLNGLTVPEAALSQLSGENLAKELTKDPRGRELFEKLKRVEISNGALQIETR